MRHQPVAYAGHRLEGDGSYQPGRRQSMSAALCLPKGVEQVPLVPDQGAAEPFAAAGLRPSLHERVHSRHPHAAEHYLDPRVVEHGVEQGGELSVAVPDQEPCPAADVLQIHHQVLRAWATQEAVQWAVAPRMRIRRLVCSMTTSTYIRVPVRVTVSKKSQASRVSAWARRKAVQVVGGALGCGVDPGLVEDLPHGGGGGLDTGDEQFAVDAPVAPAGVLPGQA